MRVLHTADIHGRIDFLESTRSGAARAHDVPALSDDFTDFLGREPVRKQRRDIVNWLRAQRTTIVGCSGSHDLQWTHEAWTPARWVQKAMSNSAVVDAGWPRTEAS